LRQQLENLRCIIFQKLFCSGYQFFFLTVSNVLDSDPTWQKWWPRRAEIGGSCGLGTYRKVEFAAFSDFFRQYLEELEDARYARGLIPERLEHHGHHVLPFRHLDG
jgi:hypothetical protein